MVRKARIKSETGIYHVILRGINREIIFEEAEDYQYYLQVLRKYQEIKSYKLYAYCLMNNHIHLLIGEEKETIEVFMKRIEISFVIWYNKKYKRCGHLFQDRYMSEPVEDESYCLTVLRYIHQNPLKAGVVKEIGDYQWSSYYKILEEDELLDFNFVLHLFEDELVKAKEAYKEFNQEAVNDEGCLNIYDPKRISDNEAKELIKKMCEVEHLIEVKFMPIEKRNTCLKELFGKGIAIRQMSRLTGISRKTLAKY